MENVKQYLIKVNKQNRSKFLAQHNILSEEASRKKKREKNQYADTLVLRDIWTMITVRF